MRTVYYCSYDSLEVDDDKDGLVVVAEWQIASYSVASYTAVMTLSQLMAFVPTPWLKNLIKTK